MASNGEQTSQQAAGFWKPRHAVIGLGVLGLIIVLAVRGCGGDTEDVVESAEPEQNVQRQSVPLQAPAQGVYGNYPPVQQPYPGQPYGQPQPQPQAWPQQQAPVYPQQAPAYVQPPQYGQVQPPAGQQPGYGYQPQPVPAPQQYPVPDPDNPWAASVPRSYGQAPGGYGGPATAPQWGQHQHERPVYRDSQAGRRYRPLDHNRSGSRSENETRAPAPVWPNAPYDRRGGSSYGSTGSPGAPHPGYYGAAPVPYGGGYPGYGWPGY